MLSYKITYTGRGQCYAFEGDAKECLGQKLKAACDIGSIIYIPSFSKIIFWHSCHQFVPFLSFNDVL